MHQASLNNSSPIRTHPPELVHSPSMSSLVSRYRHPPLTAEHLKLKLRLSPLIQVEEALIRKLTPEGSGEFEATQLRANGSHADRARALDKEVAVNSQFAWKGMLSRVLYRNSQDSLEHTDPDVSGVFNLLASEPGSRLSALDASGRGVSGHQKIEANRLLVLT